MCAQEIRRHYEAEHFNYCQALRYLMLLGFNKLGADNFLNPSYPHV